MIFPIYKPAQWTSFDVVKKIRVLTGEKKVGHAGTLDPFAEGILVIGIGDNTKILSNYVNQQKEYKAELKLGEATDTGDIDGKVISSKPIPDLSSDLIEMVFSKFRGVIEQIPPMYSAKKINGTRLYKMARKNIKVKRQPVTVEIYELKLMSIIGNTIHFSTVCSKGTYIRQLGVDIAKELGTVGHLISLLRTRIGTISVKDCIRIQDFNKQWIYTKV